MTIPTGPRLSDLADLQIEAARVAARNDRFRAGLKDGTLLPPRLRVSQHVRERGDAFVSAALAAVANYVFPDDDSLCTRWHGLVEVGDVELLWAIEDFEDEPWSDYPEEDFPRTDRFLVIELSGRD